MEASILRFIWKNTLELPRKFCKIKNSEGGFSSKDRIILQCDCTEKNMPLAQEYTNVSAEHERKSRDRAKYMLKHNTCFTIMSEKQK